ncbi:hypothetical protein VPH35_025909 [Triticum aestivum]
MKKKLYLLFFTMEGFDQTRDESDGNDEDPDQNNGDGDKKELEEDSSDKKHMEDNRAEPTDELDRVNFPPKQNNGSGTNKKVQQVFVSAEEFHPEIMNDEAHNSFLGEIRKSGPGESKEDTEMEISTPCSYQVLPGDIEGAPMSVHMDYCSKQLNKFEMEETDGEEEDMKTKLQCLPEDLAMAISSVKRSLIESMDNAESEKKKKLNTEKNTVWGPVLINRPKTRDHGNVKIMEKAIAYLLKKNLEIPTTFNGKSFANLDNEVLASHTAMVDICVCDSTKECDDIIADLVAREKTNCL